MIARIVILASAALACGACLPAHALTQAQAQAFLEKQQPGCSIGISAPVSGRVRGSDKQVDVVSYVAECGGGGTAYITSLAALFDAGGGHIRQYVNQGLPSQLRVENISILDGVIVVRTLDLADTDAHCCPSQRGSYKAIINGGKLVVAR